MPTVIAEVFDDEIVIIHLESGAYYSLDQSGALIWELVQEGATVSDMVARLAASDGLAPEPLGAAVQHFIEELRRENLIIADQAPAPLSQQPGAQTSSRSAANAKRQFSSPHLHKYTDMQDLLLLDPIHDVTETGWPHVAVR